MLHTQLQRVNLLLSDMRDNITNNFVNVDPIYVTMVQIS